jgi:MerR family transcriptional regulator, light-induced transcriptional regulator
MSRTERPGGGGSAVSIAGVGRETGLSKDTLRMWERRYGFPIPERDSRGERAYAPEQVEKLRVISRLLDRGLRPGRLMSLPLPELIERFKAREPASEPDDGSDKALRPMMAEALRLLKRYDEAGLRAQLSRVLLRLGLLRFAIDFAAPLNELIGEAWSSGEIAVSHEHLYTEQMQYLLRHGMGSIAPSAQRPTVMLTTLPGEEHQLGLLMAQVCLAAEGARCISLGVQTPASDIVHAARQQGVDAIGLSFSEALKLNAAHDMLEDLRARLAAEVEIWAGGKLWNRARRPVRGVRFVTQLTQIPAILAAHHESRVPEAAR